MRAALGLLAAALFVSGCARIIPRPAPGAVAVPPPVAAPVIASAIAAGVVAAPLATIPPDHAARALAAFRLSCAALTRRNDESGLTRPADWAPACRDAQTASDPAAFFTSAFEPVRVGEGTAFATGYYEPEIAGSRVAAPGYPAAIYRKPPDLVEQPSVQCPADWPGGTAAPSYPPCKRVTARGRMVDGVFRPYFDRAEIEDGALAGRRLEIAYAADPVELFFLQVQGSGRLRLPDGQVMRIGYDGQNGHEYTGIGRLMRERGLLAPGQASMQGLMAYLRANPEEGRAIMRENRSWVFFRELTGPGPLGALNIPVTARATVATDPAFVPLGAPVLLAMDRPEASGLWIAQDTGGAIKGANRFDTFWGAGDEARTIAGGMSSRGSAIILVPRGTLARLAAAPTP